MLEKIISGGQTGADIGAVDAAIAHAFPYGGTLPAGRRNEIGKVPLHYTEFEECKDRNYMVRTELNIFDSDGTLVFTNGTPTSGTAATIKLAKKLKRHRLVIDIAGDIYMPDRQDAIVSMIGDFVNKYDIKILNVAGPRESKTPGVHDVVFSIIGKYLISEYIHRVH